MEKIEDKKINYWKVASMILLIALFFLMVNHECRRDYGIKKDTPELNCRYAIDIKEEGCEKPVPVVCYYVYSTINPYCLQEDSLIKWANITWKE